ncbi:MAG: pirin family protein, partial [Pseudomonadota bacterium]
HTFSFGSYHDPRHMGFGPLRVINDDRVIPDAGFETHGHRDMEIVTYVLDGALAHKDSLGNGSVIRPGEIQRMTAGTGITHSEFNDSASDPVHFLQIWIEPDQHGLAPGYEQKPISPETRRDRFALLASPDGRDGSVTVHQDAWLWGGLLSPGAAAKHALANDRLAWLHIAEGAAEVNGLYLETGDGLAVRDEPELEIEAIDTTDILLFDMAKA